jgi:hypothetical protein
VITFTSGNYFEMNVPLNIRMFMWFLHQKVLVTRDNLAKRNCHGNMKCCLCGKEESVQHVFIDCPFSKNRWRIVHMGFNISPPLNITNLFELASWS